MITLAVDTSLAAVQAAVVDGDLLLAALSEPMARGHQERLAPLVAEALAIAGAAPADIGKVAVTVGPGSFTGLRVGLAFAKVFALARGVSCVGVGTLEALACAFAEGEVAAAIPAPHDRAYVQRFTGGLSLWEPRLLPLDAAREAAAGARAVGPGAPLLGGREADAVGWPDLAAFARHAARAAGPPDPIYLREVGALTIAERRGRGGRRAPAGPVTPVGPEAAPALAALHAQAFDRPWDAAALAALIAAPGALALAAEGDGFILLRRVLDEAEVLTLAVRPGARRRGVGRSLVEAATALAGRAGAAVVWLEAADDNAAALALYAACGFEPAGRRPRYYARPHGQAVDAVVLRRDLTQGA